MNVSQATGLRLALLADTHFWPPSASRDAFVAKADAASERDGLLTHRSPEVLAALFSELKMFGVDGGFAALHLGDAGCGGGGFQQPLAEYAKSLATFRSLEVEAGLTVHHIPGNHDLNPPSAALHPGGLSAWRSSLGPPTAQNAYRELRLEGSVADQWRVLLLDATDGIMSDVDGHGHIGEAQLGWLEARLQAAEQQHQKVILLMHQLLIDPTALAEDDDERRRRRRSPGRVDSVEHYAASLSPGGVMSVSWIAAGDLIAKYARLASNPIIVHRLPLCHPSRSRV